jgi:hypothetical protein
MNKTLKDSEVIDDCHVINELVCCAMFNADQRNE